MVMKRRGGDHKEKGRARAGGFQSLAEYRALMDAIDKALRKDPGEPLEGEELVTMTKTIGTRINAEWLVEFAQTELADLSPGRWADLCAEMALFSSWGPVATSKPEDLEIWRRRCTHVMRPSREIVSDLQTLLMSILGKFVDDAAVEFPAVELTCYVKKTGDIMSSWNEPRSIPHGFVYQVFRTLASQGARLRRCAECARIFLADRKTQKYCSSRCQGRVMQRRFVAKQNKAAR